ncbi:homocitrate synthase NifV [Desulfatibacillum alkenivorans DSM 16219]|jgi:homocitrate synthase NifV|uniref:Homocitrate synthase NifV n=1 Tax=Desulfatibacillum alkenivorans DSM 16219 TaxID=1121393 RepID=A0A1M6WXU4_9BACT|nr:hypothetical protein [Desulfatibacillum alkenivorans]SHK98506.1 homocitrate synthase NifV [Desulfatibacillum alkenivorans DSM 16219]
MEEKVPVHIIDTTLRDGEQAPGVAFDKREKIALAMMLDQAHVDELEVGIPAMGPAAQDEIKAIASLTPDCLLTAWCRALKDDIDQSLPCNVTGVHISFPVSDIHLEAMGKTRRWVLDQLRELIPYALKRFSRVSVGAQDAFRADMAFLEQFVHSANLCGAHRVRIADTVGLARPSQVENMVHVLSKAAGKTALEFHGHNDLGMAAANTIAAIEAGAQAVSVTVNGLGERAGNAPLEQVVVAVGTLDSRFTGMDATRMNEICRYVAEIANRPIPAAQPITGQAVFTHESGIHCAGILRNPHTYQPFEPETVGRDRAQLVIGRHSGSGMIRHVLAKAGVRLEEGKTESLMAAVRMEALKKRSVLSPGELVRIYNTV